MNYVPTPDGYGRLIEKQTLEIRRLLPGPIERVWAYVVESEKRRQWFADGEIPPTPGAEFEFVWRNDELGQPAGERPPGISQEHRKVCRVLEVDPPHKFAFVFGEHGTVTITLAPAGERVLLTLVHRDIPDRATELGVSAGWHVHLDVLAARLGGGATGPFWDEWRRLKGEYERRLGDG